MGDDELLPCPFCGYAHVELTSKLVSASVYCNKCGADGPMEVWLGDNVDTDESLKRRAIKAWNTRTPTAEVEKMILKQEYFKAGAKAFTDPNELYKIEFQDNLKFHFNAYEQSKRDDDNG